MTKSRSMLGRKKKKKSVMFSRSQWLHKYTSVKFALSFVYPRVYNSAPALPQVHCFQNKDDLVWSAKNTSTTERERCFGSRSE